MQFRNASITIKDKPPASSIRTIENNGDPKKSSKSKRKTSSSTILVWAIGCAGVFIIAVNFIHSLSPQGQLPSGLKVSIHFYGDEEDNNQAHSYSIFGSPNEKSASSKQQQQQQLLFDDKAGTHFLPPPRNMLQRKSKIKNKPILQATTKQSVRRDALLAKYHEAQREASEAKEVKPNAVKGIAANTEDTQPQIIGAATGKKRTSTITNNNHKASPNHHHNSQVMASKAQQAAQAQNKERAKGKVHSLQYFIELSQREGHDKERLIQLIRNNAGMELLSETTYEALPRWSQVTEMYGSKPILLGVDQCQMFQQDGDLADKYLAVAGSFNSGTNLLAKTLVRNCVLHKRQEKYGVKNRGVRWQVPYGKHTPPKDDEFRNSHVAGKSDGVVAKQVLPAVMIRDPFRWLQSMCSHHYTTRWPRVFKQSDLKRYHCPNLWPTEPEKTVLAGLGRKPLVEGHSIIVSETSATSDNNETSDAGANAGEEKAGSKEGDDTNHDGSNEKQSHGEAFDASKLTAGELKMHYFPVSVKYSNFTKHHRSLVHFYNEWYQEYMDLQDYPHLMVRMEDLLFFPDEVVPQICECAGGRIVTGNSTSPNIQLVVESAKSKHSTKFMAEGQEHTGYLDALIRYGSSETRFKGMTPQDLQYAGHYLDSTIMKLFQYGYPPS